MPNARSAFFERIAALRSAIGHDSIVAGPFTAVEDNARARITRNGLAVIGFAILEDFFRARAQEVLAHISRCGLGFNKLPPGLQRFATVRTMKAAMFQLSIKNDQRDDVSYIQEKASAVASTLLTGFEISDVAFGYDASNIAESMIFDLLEALQIAKPWESIGQIGARAGVGTLAQRHKAAFADLSIRRHRAAHDPRADIQPGELESGLLDTMGLAVGFDALLSVAGQRFRRSDKNLLSGSTKIGHQDVPIVYVEHGPKGGFRIKKYKVEKAVRRVELQQEAIETARALAMKDEAMLIVLDSRGLPRVWDFPALGA